MAGWCLGKESWRDGTRYGHIIGVEQMPEDRLLVRSLFVIMDGALGSLSAAVWVVGRPVCMGCFDRWRSFVFKES